MDFLYLMKLLKCQMQFRLLPHYTYDDWLNWEGQWELIEGIPYAMSPMPVPNHQRIAANLLI
jgi:hypothetical protein